MCVWRDEQAWCAGWREAAYAVAQISCGRTACACAVRKQILPRSAPAGAISRAYLHVSSASFGLLSLRRHAAAFNRCIERETGWNGESGVDLIYRCIDCLLIDRLPSFYIYHQCELYESLH